MTQEVHNQLLTKYDVVYLAHLSDFFSAPITKLYKELKQAYRPQYSDQQRIVIVDDVKDCDQTKSDFYVYLYKVLEHLDITNFFVLVVGQTDAWLRTCQPKTSDPTRIQFEYYRVVEQQVFQPTNFGIPETICADPWINVAIFEDGRVSACCLVEDGSEERITQSSLSNILGNNRNVKLRQDFLQGIRPVECVQCWRNEDAGKISKRLNDRFVFKNQWFNIDWNQTNATQFVSLDIKLKNTCNLSCRICSPQFSSKWYDEMCKHESVYPEVKNYKNIRLEWDDSTDQKIWNEVTAVGQQIRYITFSGGEPLLDKSHVKMLKFLIESGVSCEVNLHYNTNGTIYAEHLVPLWNKFNQVELSFSIDNVEEKFEYERYGADWDETVKVIDQYLNLDKDQYSFNINNTVSVLNVLDIYDLYQFALNKNLKLSFNMLSTPEELNITNLNRPSKQLITQKLLSVGDAKFVEIVQPVLNYLNNSDTKITNKDIINYLQKTDHVRGQDFYNTHGELGSMLNLQ